MNQEQYDLVTQQLASIAREIEEKKRPGYTTGTEDVLSNFKRIAEQTGTIPEKIAMIYMLKHLDSIRTLLNDLESEIDNDDPEPWYGRIADIFNYVRLLYALLRERELLTHGPQVPPTNGGKKS